MPTYDYRCRKCQQRFEVFHAITDEKPRRCPRCRARADRVPSGGAGLLFRGSGFHITDYRSSAYREKAQKEKGDVGGGTPESKSAPAAGEKKRKKRGSGPGRPPDA